MGLAAFQAFLKDRKSDLTRIVHHAKDCELADVHSQAWLTAVDQLAGRGEVVDFRDLAFQTLLISFLYQHFVRYDDRHLRYSVRFEQAREDDSGHRSHSLLERLTGEDAMDPLATLLAGEAQVDAPSEPGCHLSQASAWLYLLRLYDHRMKTVAQHLLISLSWCYRCHAKAIWLAQTQRPLPDSLSGKTDALAVRPWRRFRQERAPVQLSFDFGWSGSLWDESA